MTNLKNVTDTLTKKKVNYYTYIYSYYVCSSSLIKLDYRSRNCSLRNLLMDEYVQNFFPLKSNTSDEFRQFQSLLIYLLKF